MDVERILAELGVDIARTRGKEITAHCPFHDDRKPSFSVNNETGAWICYSLCGGGGVEELVSRVLGKNRGQAAKWLKERGQPSGARINKRRAGKGRLAKAIANAHPKARKACPPFDINNLPSWIVARGFKVKTLSKYQCGTSYFYDALVIPVLQSHAYIYRRAPGREPKYKYTEDFKSHNTLYGLPDVKLGKDKTIILVEGPLDCLWLRQYGYKNSLAIMGGATLGMEQRRIVKEDLKPEKVILAYDNDEAGREVTDKTVVAMKDTACYTIQWEGVEWPDEDEEDLTIVPDDVAEVPEDRLKALLENVVLVPIAEARDRIKARKTDKTP